MYLLHRLRTQAIHAVERHLDSLLSTPRRYKVIIHNCTFDTCHGKGNTVRRWLWARYIASHNEGISVHEGTVQSMGISDGTGNTVITTGVLPDG